MRPADASSGCPEPEGLGMGMRPLAGMRVVDFGIITAGASTSAILADLGAEVVKVEGPSYIDPFRHWIGAGEDDWWNRSPQFAFTNRGKLGLCVDLKRPRGRELVLDLVARSDIVIENFRVGVLDRLGLGFEALRTRNSGIILASISSQGLTGPEADAVSFGSTLEASGGLSSLVAGEDGRPLISGHALNYPDQAVSLFAAGAVLAAVVERHRCGDPIHLDISQRELTAFLIGERFTAEPAVPGDGDENILRCADGRFIVADVRSGGDRAIEVAAALPAGSAVEQLLSEGIPAELVMNAVEVYASHLRQPEIGALAHDPEGRPVKGLPWDPGGGPLSITRAAPAVGRDNAAVVCGILGRSVEEYDELVAAGVLATGPRS